MPTYTIEDLEDLEVAAEAASSLQQSTALALVVSIFERNSITYGVIGGMNFYLRGSKRTTLDVDIAVDNRPRMDALLDIFNNQQSVYRPANRMLWVSGVARIFVDVQGQLVQFDLMPKGAEGFMIPGTMAGSVDRLRVETTSVTFDCNVLAIGPLVAAKIKAHYGRETLNDYRDLMFVCTSSTYAPLVRAAAGNFRREWKECFLSKVMEKNPGNEEQIRQVLNMPRTPSPPRKHQPGPGPGGNGRGGNGGVGYTGGSSNSKKGGQSSRGGYDGGGGQHSSSKTSKHKASSSASKAGQSSSSRAPQDGDQSKDKYWTYSAQYNNWYHKHSNGGYSWASET